MNRSGLIAALLAGILSPVILCGQNGVVYFDANGNGRFDAGESGVADVAVSDGVNIVSTGADGRFSLQPSAGARHVYITVPDGYRANGRFFRSLELWEKIKAEHREDNGNE